MNIGNRLKKLREQKQIDHDTLAASTGLPLP